MPKWGALKLESHSNLFSCLRLTVGFTNTIMYCVPLSRLMEMFKYMFKVPVGCGAEDVYLVGDSCCD